MFNSVLLITFLDYFPVCMDRVYWLSCWSTSIDSPIILIEQVFTLIIIVSVCKYFVHCSNSNYLLINIACWGYRHHRSYSLMVRRTFISIDLLLTLLIFISSVFIFWVHIQWDQHSSCFSYMTFLSYHNFFNPP